MCHFIEQIIIVTLLSEKWQTLTLTISWSLVTCLKQNKQYAPLMQAKACTFGTAYIIEYKS